MIRFEMDVAAADLTARTIEGVLVPYGETATIQGRKFRFKPGSVKMARSRTPLLVDHDRSSPVGVLAELVPGEAGELARFRIDQTPEGDTALVQAASGSRGSLSVGAEVEARETGGVYEVDQAEVWEVSLCALGAFDGATVTRVAATADAPDAPDPEGGQLDEDGDPDPPPPEPHPDQMELPEEPAPAATSEPERMAVMTQENLDAAAPTPPVILTARAPDPAEMGAGEVVSLFVRAQHGEAAARRYVEAALAESISTDVAGLLPPQYERTVIGGKDVARPLYNAFRSRPLPGVGLAVNKPKWTTPPNGAWAATVDADATTGTVVIGSQSASVQRWDWAGAIPWVVVQRSDPSIVDEIYAEAIQDFYLDVEAKIYGELTAAAPGVATSLGAAIAEFYEATGNQRAPEIIVMSPDVWGEFADATAMGVAVAAGAVSSENLTTSFAGIPAVSSGFLATGETILATRRAVDARVTEPVRLTANAIGALNVELAVVGEGLFDTDYPAELLKFAAIVPLATPEAREKAARERETKRKG